MREGVEILAHDLESRARPQVESFHTMDLKAHSYEVHMKPFIHNFPWNLFELHKDLLLTSYELHIKFM